jgi:Cyclopropane fatty acid synthase and related methyltransferases
MTGDCDLFSRFMKKDAEQFFQRLGVTPGTLLLDVGCGAGQLALIAARAGARVIGCDIATNWLKRAERARRPKDSRSRLKKVMPNRCLMPMLSLTQ